MSTLKELEERREKLINRNLAKKEIEDIGNRRQQLRREINELEHPRLASAKKGIGKFAGRTLNAAGMIGSRALNYKKPKMTKKKKNRKGKSMSKMNNKQKGYGQFFNDLF